MIKRQSIFTCFWRDLPSDRRPNSVTLCVFALSAMLGADAAPAAPVILSQPFSAKPGDVISLEGSGFGSAPTVYLQPSRQTSPIALATKAAVGGGVIVEVPKTAAFDLYSVIFNESIIYCCRAFCLNRFRAITEHRPQANEAIGISDVRVHLARDAFQMRQIVHGKHAERCLNPVTFDPCVNRNLIVSYFRDVSLAVATRRKQKIQF